MHYEYGAGFGVYGLKEPVYGIVKIVQGKAVYMVVFKFKTFLHVTDITRMAPVLLYQMVDTEVVRCFI